MIDKHKDTVLCRQKFASINPRAEKGRGKGRVVGRCHNVVFAHLERVMLFETVCLGSTHFE